MKKKFPKTTAIALFPGLMLLWLVTACSQSVDPRSGTIDRYALVHRHTPSVSAPDPLSPFTLGNGEFAFTVDVTGLQSFPEYYEQGIPLGTLAQWGWHSVGNPRGYRLEQTFKPYDTYGREVPYAADQHSDAGQWLRANPHRLHLGQVGLAMENTEGDRLGLEALSDIDQRLDLWEGMTKSRFTVLDESVSVTTAVHPEWDQVSALVASPLLATGNLAIELRFPYGSLSWGKATADWDSPDQHSSELILQTEQSALIKRTLDTDQYFVQVSWEGAGQIEPAGAHTFKLTSTENDGLAFSVSYWDREPAVNNVSAADTLQDNRKHWENFWETGGAIDLSDSTDPRAEELERRIVLSRYLTAIQTSGSLPPAETGLTYNSWYGKFHLEMHWWHGVHYVLWGKPELFEKSLPWYSEHLPQARAKAERQGYEGARWPKMVGPNANESPSTIGVFLIWQQPHPIYYAELLYRYHDGDPAIVARYQDLVFETAEFMASYAHYDAEQDRYVLGPPLIPGQEIYPPEETINPAFELSYWRYGLQTAQKWRQRVGLQEHEHWADVLDKLSPLPEKDGFYQNAGNALETFGDPRHRNDHPSILGVYGMLPNDVVNLPTMTRTLDEIMASWNWDRTWGWDYPMAAMSAARLGQPETAIDVLLMQVQKNRYLNNGHNYQDEDLTLYLPGNGGLLSAVAMMAAGWDGAPEKHAPGFPDNGKWVVKHEGLTPLQ